jgi:hypothetical protein
MCGGTWLLYSGLWVHCLLTCNICREIVNRLPFS